MASTNKPRVLPDIAALQAQIKALEEQNAALSANQASSKEPKAYVGTYTPKKGKDQGVPGQRLFVEGNFFPLVLKQAQCQVIADNMAVLIRFAKTGH